MLQQYKWVIALSILSTLLVLLGVIAKIQHWDTIKPVMLLGLALQIGVMLYTMIRLVKKNNKS
jgi:predicted neutral ceramidase superfamily lipid hydrolase